MLSSKLMPNSSDISEANLIDLVKLPKPCVATTLDEFLIIAAASPKLPVNPASWATPRPAVFAIPE